MRRLASPSGLFGIWTLLFLMPAVPIIIRRFSEPHVRYHVSLPAPEMMKPYAILWALMPLLRFAPLSFPFFAMVFAAWPRVTGRSLDTVLGRWQFALATAPAVLCVFLDAAIIGWNRPAMAGPVNVTTAPLLLVVLEWTIFIVSAFWLASVTLFCFNVAKTLRNGAAVR